MNELTTVRGWSLRSLRESVKWGHKTTFFSLDTSVESFLIQSLFKPGLSSRGSLRVFGSKYMNIKLLCKIPTICQFSLTVLQMVSAALSATLTKTNYSTGFCLLSTTNHPVSNLICLPNFRPFSAVESNGVQISEFIPGKWFFLGLAHDKPSLARAHLTAIVNDK